MYYLDICRPFTTLFVIILVDFLFFFVETFGVAFLIFFAGVVMTFILFPPLFPVCIKNNYSDHNLDIYL